MNPKVVFGLLIVGSVAAMLVAAHRPDPAHAAQPHVPAHERPWLSAAAIDQLLGYEGSMGPIFAGIDLGGPGPTREQRARVEAFAKPNGIDVTFEVVANELVAVRFGVTFGGCCGYEGADTFARNFARPFMQEFCGSPHEWMDDWTATLSGGTHVRGRVRVNRVEIRWESSESFDELLTNAEALLGTERSALREREGDRMLELEPNHRYVLERPYKFDGRDHSSPRTKLADRTDLGFVVVAEHGVITEVSFVLEASNDDQGTDDLRQTLLERWGRPQNLRGNLDELDVGTWKRRGHTFVADLSTDRMRVTLRAN